MNYMEMRMSRLTTMILTWSSCFKRGNPLILPELQDIFSVIRKLHDWKVEMHVSGLHILDGPAIAILFQDFSQAHLKLLSADGQVSTCRQGSAITTCCPHHYKMACLVAFKFKAVFLLRLSRLNFCLTLLGKATMP